MTLRYMLDTNICIYTIKNKPAAVREQFQKHQHHLCISSIVLTELLYGAEKSTTRDKSLALVEGMAARLEVLDFDDNAAAHAAEIRAGAGQTRRAHRPLRCSDCRPRPQPWFGIGEQ